MAADPAPAVTLPTWESLYRWSGGDGYAGWTWRTTGANGAAYGYLAGGAGRPGLTVWPVGEREYAPGSAEWIFRAPGTMRIAQARFESESFEKLFVHHCLRLGRRSGADDRAPSSAARHRKTSASAGPTWCSTKLLLRPARKRPT
jgi:hypothetical protein